MAKETRQRLLGGQSLLWLRRLFLYGAWPPDVEGKFLLALAFYPLPVFTFLQPSRPQRNRELRNLTSSDIPAVRKKDFSEKPASI